MDDPFDLNVAHDQEARMIEVIGSLARLARKMTFNLLPESLLSFLIVGSLGVVVHLSVLKISMATWMHDFKYANLTAMLFAATFNYVANNKSTFKDRSLAGQHAFVGYFCYIGITALGMGLSLFISTRFYSQYGMPMIAALCGIVVGSFWNYFMSYTIIWKFLFKLSRQHA
jgi:putative flippase GtrA